VNITSLLVGTENDRPASCPNSQFLGSALGLEFGVGAIAQIGGEVVFVVGGPSRFEGTSVNATGCFGLCLTLSKSVDDGGFLGLAIGGYGLGGALTVGKTALTPNYFTISDRLAR